MRIWDTPETTLGELIANRYPDFKVVGGSAPMDTDITHGIEIDERKIRPSEYTWADRVEIYPCILWTDGLYKPCHYWGSEHYIILERRTDNEK